MRVLVLVSVICMQFVWSYGVPAGSQGVGAYAYQDSSGNRYGGTYDLEDGKVVNVKGTPPDAVPSNLIPGKVAPGSLAPGDFLPGNFAPGNFAPGNFAPGNFAPGNFAPGNFAPANFAPFQFAFPDFFPDEFRNLQNLWQEDFVKGFDDQELGLKTAEVDSGITSNTGDVNDISRFTGFGGLGQGMPGFGNFQGFGMPGMGMPGFGSGMGMPGMNMPPMRPYSAFAGAAAGPGFVQHQDFISPTNPNMPNVNVMKYTDPNPPGSGQFYSVSSKSYSSSSNINGQEMNNRGSETMVNNNGEVTKYSVKN